MLIAGNASGSSSVIVNAYGSGAFTSVDTPSATHGISLIQVAGNSSVGAFTLPSGYVTGGTPYQYQLYAFGPGSPNGAAAAGQSLVGNAGSQWDYRLENVYVSPEGPVTPTEPVPPESRPEVAPQVPAYIALPTALFGAGFQDIDNLHRRLGEIRDDQLTGLAPAAELFVRGYGSQLNYTSNRSFTDFGFNSTQDYAAVQFGANYIVYNGANGTLRAGLAAMFGQLWYQPHALDGASSGKFNTDTLAGTLTWQSTAGWYVDAIVSGGDIQWQCCGQRPLVDADERNLDWPDLWRPATRSRSAGNSWRSNRKRNSCTNTSISRRSQTPMALSPAWAARIRAYSAAARG